MAQARFKVDLSESPLMIAMRRAADTWPQSRRDTFFREWKSLEAHGAEMVECVSSGKHIGVRISDDFKAHCAAYGIHAHH